jgi:hypothetical protein
LNKKVEKEGVVVKVEIDNEDDADDVMVLKNLTVNCTSNYCQRGVNFNTTGSLTLNNVIVSGENITYAVNFPGSSDESNVTITDSYLRGNIALNVWGENMRINATNSEFVSYDANPVENYSAIVLNNDGSTFANETVVNINGGKIIALDENGEESYAIRNSTMTGQVIVSETTEVVGTVSNPVAVVVYEGYNEFYSFTTLQQAIDKVCKDNNGSVRLIKDITVEEPITIPADGTVAIDLNGKTITGTIHKNDGHVIKNDGTLRLENGTVSSNANNGGSAVMNSGTAVITGVTLNGAPNADGSWPSYAVNNKGIMEVTDSKVTSYHGGIASYGENAVVILNNSELDMVGIAGFTSHGIYTYNSGKVVVNGGTYANKATDQDSTGASVINGTVEINAGSFTGRIANYSGTPVIKGGTFKADPNNYLAEGYQAVKKNDAYVVIKSGYAYVSTADELVAALAEEKNVFFANDITVAATKGGYNKAGILQNKAQTIDGNGHTLTVTGAGATWDCAIYTNGGVIKNLTVAGAMRGIFTAGQSSDLYIENVTFKNVIYTFNSDGKMPANPFGVYVSNSNVNGWTSHSNMHTEVVYTNCSFGEGSGYKYCRPYGTTSFVGCTFCSGYTVDKSQTSDITFRDCTFEE